MRICENMETGTQGLYFKGGSKRGGGIETIQREEATGYTHEGGSWRISEWAQRLCPKRDLLGEDS